MTNLLDRLTALGVDAPETQAYEAEGYTDRYGTPIVTKAYADAMRDELVSFIEHYYQEAFTAGHERETAVGRALRAENELEKKCDCS